MSNLNEKLLFSQRLQASLKEANHPISPTYLSTEFNYRFSGSPVSVQAANNWLHGKAIPSQDKLAILAIWLNQSTQWLRFGDAVETPSPIAQSSSVELDYFVKFKRLKFSQQSIIKDLIDEFLKH